MGDRSRRNQASLFLPLAAGGLVLILCFYGYGRLLRRSGIPPEIDRARIVRIDATDIKADRDEEFALARKAPGQPTEFVLRAQDGREETIVLPLVPYYARTIYPLIYLLIGLACIGLGFLTRILRPDNVKARIYYGLSLAFGLGLIVSGETYGLGRGWMTFTPSVAFILSYAFAPALLVRFALAFGGEGRPARRALIYALPGVIASAQVALFLAAFVTPSPSLFRTYNASYPVFRVYVMGYILLAVGLLGRALRRSSDDDVRAQIQWIFYGLAVGMIPFLFLYQLPVALGAAPVLSEELAAIFFIGIPVTFAVAIVKHRLMAIEVVINRSLVYSLLTVVTVGGYLVFIELAQKIFARWIAGRELGVTAVGVFLAALAFQPAERRIQRFVDKSFFRQSYDYRRTILAFTEKVQQAVDRDELLDLFRRDVMRVLPVESLWIGPGAHPTAAPEAGGPKAEGAGVTLPLDLGPEGGPCVLALGRKKSGGRYTRDDLELLRTMASELQVSLDRLRLREEVIYERASREKLDELNRLKTEFISTVSHELRTPLGSIQSLAELLQSGRVRDRDRADKFLGQMASESARLSRFLHNILDYGKIEQRVKTYHIRPAVLQDVIEEAAAVFRPLAESRGFRLDLALPPEPVRLDCDADAVKQALINLIDNAIKYSRDEKVVSVELARGDRTWDVRVRDRGIGISPADRERIFEKFFRASEAGRLCPEGAGLGLKIVRHIMDAHQGEVRVESKEGEGSVFTLAFPMP